MNCFNGSKKIVRVIKVHPRVSRVDILFNDLLKLGNAGLRVL